jgi:hypothetical protein
LPEGLAERKSGIVKINEFRIMLLVISLVVASLFVAFLNLHPPPQAVGFPATVSDNYWRQLYLFVEAEPPTPGIREMNDAALTHPLNPFGGVTQAISSAFRAKKFDIDDLDKLDFSMPANGKHPQLEIFNPAGPFNPHLPNGEIVDINISTPASEIAFVLRRIVDGRGTIREALYGVVTHVDPDKCESFEIAKPEVSVSLDFHAGAHAQMLDIPDVPFFEFACVKDGRNQWYLFGVIFGRLKGPDDSKWRIW